MVSVWASNFTFPGPHFLHLQNRDNTRTYLIGLLWRINVKSMWKHLEQCLARFNSHFHRFSLLRLQMSLIFLPFLISCQVQSLCHQVSHTFSSSSPFPLSLLKSRLWGRVYQWPSPPSFPPFSFITEPSVLARLRATQLEILLPRLLSD